MALRKLARSHEQLGSLALFVALEEADSAPLQDAERHQAFLREIGRGLSTSLSNEARLHGWRVQSLFEATVVELGAVKLLKTEDEGECYYEEDEPVKLPDFRLVLLDGTNLLVEVKNVPPKEFSSSVGRAEFDGLIRFADMEGCRLLFAHYWSGMNLWTLVDSTLFESEGNRVRIGMETAGVANEFGFLGDAFLATTPPLTFRLKGAEHAPAFLGTETEGGREARFTVGDVEVQAAGRVLGDPDEKRLAQALMFFGRWEMTELAEVVDGRIVAIDYTFEPVEVEDQAVAPHRIVGTLSSIYAASFNLATLSPDGVVSRLRREPEPGATARLVPPDYWSREHELPLWRFNFSPSRGPRARATDAPEV